MRELRGKTALVTGASRGLGIEIAEALAREGMNLVIAARSAEELLACAERLRALGVRVEPVPTDLADPEQLTRLVERAEAFGGVDVLVNNAGLDEVLVYHQVAPEQIDQIIAVNLRAPMQLTRALLPGMIERKCGHVVNIASILGLVGGPYNECYSATKHGLIGFSRSLRLTLANEGHAIGVSAICPGLVAERGMYAQMVEQLGAEAPRLLGGTTSKAVARAVVRAIRFDRAELVVNSIQGRSLRLLAVVYARVIDHFMRIVGATRYFGRLAERRAHTD
jgi:short-subunit dehydrogenase